MANAKRRRVRAAALTTAATTVAALLALTSPVTASADTAPASSSTPATASADSLSTAQLANGVGWSQAVANGVVYVGGSFTGVRAAGASSTGTATTASNLMSYTLSTGALRTSFLPTLNGQVEAVATSADGSILYVGGAFTTVNGTTRNHIAAFNTSTGALTSFNPNVNGQVNAIAVASNGTVYFGGQFTSVSSTTRTRAAAVTSAGALTTWAPTNLDNAVKSIALSQDGTKIALGGFFSSIDGSTGSGIAVTDTTSGTALQDTQIRQYVNDGSTTSAIWGISSDANNFYLSGYYSQQAPDGSGNLEGTVAVNWNSGNIVWWNDCHGDEYDNAILNGVVYVVGHPHYCADIQGGYPQQQLPGQTSPTYQRTIALAVAGSGQNVKANTILQPRYYDRSTFQSPTMLDWFPTLKAGTFTGSSQAAYNVITSGNYVLEAGEFPTVNGTTQYGVARFALSNAATNKVGPQLSGSSFPLYASTLTSGKPRITWLANYDLDNENLSYTLYRGSTAIYTTTAASRVWYQRPTLSYTDTGATAGTSATYKVVASDSFGNSATSASLSYAPSSSSQSSYAQQIVADGATSYWRLGESSGTAIADTAGALPATTHGGVTLGTTGAIGDSNTAATFDGTSGTTIATNSQTNPTDTLSVEAWFKTSSTAGGEIIGAGDAQTVTSTTVTMGGQTMTFTGDSNNHDREISTTADGHVTFSLDPGAVQTLTSANAGYNDGKWHQVVATESSSGSVLYIDGAKSAADSTMSRGVGAEMYWRIGGDSGYAGAPDPNAPPGPPAQVNNYFTGSIDEPAAFVGTALTAAQVANEYSLATGGTTTPTQTAPTASFTESASGLAVSVDGSGSAATTSGATIKSYAWDFGDGGSASTATATHTYAQAGTYTVTLTVTDSNGLTGTSSQSIQVTSGGTTSTTIAKDAFSRTTSSSLGSADTGGAYTISGTASKYSVNGSAAQLSDSAASTKKAILGSTSSSDTDITAQYSLSALPAGATQYIDLIGRSVGTSGDYRARVGVSAAGALTIQAAKGDSTTLKSAKVSGLTYAAGDVLAIDLQVWGTGTTNIRANVWDVTQGQSEPTTWQVSTTDTTSALQAAGSVGFGAYLGSAATNGPITVTVDNLLAAPTGN